MRIKIPEITVGIPAYNESANIGLLLSDIKKQKLENFKLKQIIVSSDGSTDQTNKIVKKFKGVKLFANKDRKGLSRGLNQIISATNTEVLIILNADIRIRDLYCISRLASEILHGNDLVSCPIVDNGAKSFMAQTLSISMLLKEQLFKNIRNGVNPYVCHGPARAFSKNFYKKLFFPLSIGEDMYSYFACIENKFKFYYVRDTFVNYKLPETFADHNKQSSRFLSIHHHLSKYINSTVLENEMRISFKDYIIGAIHSLPVILKNIPHVLIYIGIVLVTRISSFFKKTNQQIWSISTTSK